MNEVMWVLDYMRDLGKQLLGNIEKTVCTLEPDIYPGCEKMRNGLIDSLLKKAAYTYSFQYPQGKVNNSIMTQFSYKALVRYRPECILSVGSQYSVNAQQIMKSCRVRRPFLFVEVPQPERLNLIESMENPGEYMGGMITSLKEYTQHIENLVHLQPHMRSLLVIYSTIKEEFGEESALQIKQLCAERDIQVILLPITDKATLREKAYAVLLQGVIPDVIMMLRHPSIMASIKELQKFAVSVHVPLFACDMGSIEVGAAFGFGNCEYALGEEISERVHDIVFFDYDPREHPIEQSEIPHTMLVNERTMYDQGLVLEESALNWLYAHGGEKKYVVANF